MFLTSQKVEIWQPFCLCKLDGQNSKISFGNRVYWIQRTRIMLKSLVPSLYPKMPLVTVALKRDLFFFFYRNGTSLLRKISTNTFSIVDWIHQITWFDYLCSMLETDFVALIIIKEWYYTKEYRLSDVITKNITHDHF